MIFKFWTELIDSIDNGVKNGFQVENGECVLT